VKLERASRTQILLFPECGGLFAEFEGLEFEVFSGFF
jgi:hypothetical protein